MFQRMKCGNCGCKTAEIKAVKHPSQDAFTKIMIICTKCRDRTILSTGTPVITAEWGKNSSGVFCVGWRKK